MSEKEFRVNEHIVLKLENGKTNIYVDNKQFRQCKYLLIMNPHENEKQWEIDSIDDVAEELSSNLRGGLKPYELGIDNKTEFWGHCSNLQTWAENDYDTDLLHSNISLPLLRKLYKFGR